MLSIPIKDTDLLKTARERFKLADDADSNQQAREIEDLRFYAGDQWPADIRAARSGRQPISGMPAVPARPTLVINKVREPVRQIQNQVRGSDIGIELVPADDFGDLGLTPDDTEVTLREGLIRRIQRESQAQDARQWAADRAFIAGRGYYLVMTRFLPGKTWDQEVYVHRIYNQAGVLLDPSHTAPDGSDADWEFMGTWVPWDRFAAEHPTLADGSANPFSEASSAEFTSMAEQYPDWYQADGDQRAVRVVDYWYTERSSVTYAVIEDGSVVDEDQVPEGVEAVDTRTDVVKSIKWVKIGGGSLELEKTDWAGPDMPIVKVLGEELQPYDGERRAEGMVRPARESNMGFNYMASKAVEVLGLSPIPLLQLDPEAIEGYEEWYAVLNTRTLPYAPYRTYNDEGKEIRAPHRLPVDPNIQPIMQALLMFNQAVQDTTAVSDPAMGRTDPSVKSAKHAQFLIEQSAGGTSNYMDNLARSMRYEGQIENNLLFPIYGARPGRMVRILTGEGENESMRLGDPQQQGQPDPQARQQRATAEKVGKLTKDAHFNVIVKISKNTENRRMQESSALGELIAAEPQMMGWFGDLYFSARDIPNRKQLAERAKVMLAPPIQKMLADKEQGKEMDPAAMAEIQQLQQQLQELTQIAQQMDQEIKTKGAETQAKGQIEQMKLQSAEKLKGAELEVTAATEKMKADAAERENALNNLVKLAIAELQANQADAHDHADALRSEMGLTHEAGMAAAEAGQAERMAEMGNAQAVEASERGHQQALEQQAAAMPPEEA